MITPSNPRGAGRKPSPDKRGQLPYRLRASVIEKCKRLGRDKVESIIEEANETRDKECSASPYSPFCDWLATCEGRKCHTPPQSNTDKVLQEAKLKAAFEAGKRSIECACGDDSTGWAEWSCCNICESIIEDAKES